MPTKPSGQSFGLTAWRLSSSLEAFTVPLPRTHRITGNRFNRIGQVIPDRRSYFDWGDDYESGFPLRPARKSSPARRDYRAARAERRSGQRPAAA